MLLFGEVAGDAGSEAHFLLVTQLEVAVRGLQCRLPGQQPAELRRGQFMPREKFAHRLTLGRDECRAGGELQAAPLHAGRERELAVLDAGLVAPEVVAAQVAEGEPDSRVHVGMIGGVGPFHRGIVAGQAGSPRAEQVGPVGAEQLGVAKEKRSHGTIAVRHLKAIFPCADRKCLGRGVGLGDTAGRGSERDGRPRGPGHQCRGGGRPRE